MFVGAIESEFRRWLHLNADAFRGRSLFVGCSGNFTIEQILGPVAGAVHSNDVSIYSHFLGHHLASQPFACAIKDPAWAWLEPFLEANAGAAMVLLFELLKWDPNKNSFQKRFHDHIMGTWEWHFEKTVESVEHAKSLCHLTSYRSSDVWDFADRAFEMDPDGVFLGFLPFYKGGYEKLYRKLDDILAWERPSYEIIDAKRKAELIDKIKRFDHILIDDVLYENQQAVMLKKKTATKSMWLYSNLRVKEVLVQPHTREKATCYPMLTPADIAALDPATAEVIIKRVPADEINYFRNRYLAKNIVFSNGTWSFLFFLNGKLFGFAIAGESRYPTDGLYLMSDFVIPDVDDRLSKLLLLLLQSRHFREVLEELRLARVPFLDTSAFTDKPVSMNYRGIWELVKRAEDANGKKFLNYRTQTGLHDDKEAIATWLTKFRKKSKNSTRS